LPHSKSNLLACSAPSFSGTLTCAAAVTAAFQEQTAPDNQTAEGNAVTSRKTSLGRFSDTILDPPQTVDVIAQKVIHERGVNDLKNALKDISGKTRHAGESWLSRRQAAAAPSNPDTIKTAQIGCNVAINPMSARPATDKLSLTFDGCNLINTYKYTNSYSLRPMQNHIMTQVGRTFLLTANPSL
jgi:hypothetical protein